MKTLKLLICLTLGMLYSSNTIEAAKANFDRSKLPMKMDCKKLDGDAKKKCLDMKKDEHSTRAIDHNASRSNNTNSKNYHDGSDLILRKRPGRAQLNTNDDCDDKKSKCNKKAKKP